MHNAVFIVGVAVAVAVLAGRAVARRIGLPDAVLFVVVGLIVSFVPGVPGVTLPPDVVLLLFLPPLIYYAGFFTDPRATRADAVSISGLAVGLVVLTTVAVGLAVHRMVPDVPWPAALAFGAAVAPPDPVAATSVLQRIGAPRRIVTILEGEGLANDGVSLTIFGVAIEAVGTGFSPTHTAVRLLEAVVGGVAFGLFVGWAVTRLRRRVRDTESQVVLSLLTPYIAYIPVERFHGSGVLATVAAAGWLGTRGRGLFQPAARLQTETFWRALNFLLESLLFVLLGLQVRAVAGSVGGYSVTVLARDAAVVVVTAVAARLLWMALFPTVVARLRRSDSIALLPRRHRVLIGYAGLRGAVSFAIALSIPTTTGGGAPFPHRSLLLLLAMIVILFTLVGQGASLPAVLRLLDVGQSDRERTEGARGRQAAAEAALGRLDELTADERVDDDLARSLRQLYESRLDRLRVELDSEEQDQSEVDRSARKLRLELLGSQRGAIRTLYDRGEISADTMRDISRELDLEEARLVRSR